LEGFLLKLVATPLLVGAASLAGRRWGAEVGGWLVGIPFTSGPIALFLALDSGRGFAAQAATGILAGTVSQAAFAVAYAWTTLRAGWPASLGAATAAFLSVTLVMSFVRVDPLPTFAAAIASLVVALAVMPRRRAPEAATRPLPAWDIPARMVVATVFVIALTAAAPALGPHLAGLLAPFPLYATVLSVFAQRLAGAGSAIAVLRGLLAGLFAFALFFLTVALLLEPAGIAVAFAVALGVALVAQGVSLAATRRFRLVS
jgi:hypothetical protein